MSPDDGSPGADPPPSRQESAANDAGELVRNLASVFGDPPGASPTAAGRGPGAGVATDASRTATPIGSETGLSPGAAPKSAAHAPRRATFASRFAAIVLDLIVLAAAQVALGWTARAAVATAGRLGQPLAGAEEIAELLAATGALVLPAVYFTALHAGDGRTLGKHAMHLRVARPDGRPIGILRSLLRWAGYEISALPLGLGFALALGPRRRALHDLLADTVVLDVGPEERT